jgi:hypothetical protein
MTNELNDYHSELRKIYLEHLKIKTFTLENAEKLILLIYSVKNIILNQKVYANCAKKIKQLLLGEMLELMINMQLYRSTKKNIVKLHISFNEAWAVFNMNLRIHCGCS